ncbi:hypothetical protein QEH42_gp069 [Microbacterium phage Pumpernickel]|uniref:Uncharacterized protein n=1 Tax=Microbacterium phage Pumpernickel TaxID=2885983 RepID=A0AAE8Y729_9CAUD|nr:hypothetical protein QEH42_gp069 [Microbacterium phage Pumpernickel]UDL15860.1 hypothetical protein SEA_PUMPERNICKEL_69 [Microbacterium phage Pumpernickel]
MTANRWRVEREVFQTRVSGDDVNDLAAAIARELTAYKEWYGEFEDGSDGNLTWYVDGDTIVIEWEGTSTARPVSYRMEDI